MWLHKAVIAAFVAAAAVTTAAATPADDFKVCQDTFTQTTAAPNGPLSNTTACDALDELARCIGVIQAGLVAAGTPDKGQQYSLWLQFWQASFGEKYDCANAVDRVVPPTIKTKDQDLVISTDGKRDVQFQRYRRESVSIWDIVAQVNSLREQGSSLEDAYKVAIAGAEDAAALARGALEAGLKKTIDAVHSKADALDKRVDGVVADQKGATADVRAEMGALETRMTKQQGDATVDLQKAISAASSAAAAALGGAKDDIAQTIAANEKATAAEILEITQSAAATAQLAASNKDAVDSLQAASTALGKDIAAGAAATSALKSTVEGSVAASIAAASKATQDLRVKVDGPLSQAVDKSQSCCDANAAALAKQLGCAAKGLYLRGDACAAPTANMECTASSVGTIAVILSDVSVCATGKSDGKTIFAWKPIASTLLDKTQGLDKDSPASSCKAIKEADSSAESGLYWIKASAARAAERTYCEMTLDGGGWTLVASVHEDNRNSRGDAKDRWSSTRGYTGDAYGTGGGDKHWESDTAFGSPENAAKDDFKTFAYSEMHAEDLMVMNVRNGASWQEFGSKASMAQVTTNQFLTAYSPPNMAGIFRRHLLRFGCSNQGPSNMRFTKWVKGSHQLMEAWSCPNCRGESEPGAFSFSQCNCEGSRFAFCQVQRQGCNIEHFCIGSSFVSGHGPAATNDFNGWDWHFLSEGWSKSWAVSADYYAHAVFFLYR